MKNESLKLVLMLLIEARETMHSDANVSVEQLDKAICLLEAEIEMENADTNDEVLSVIGKVLTVLPSIARLIEMFRD